MVYKECKKETKGWRIEKCGFVGNLKNLINGNGNEGGFWIRRRSEAVAERHGSDVRHDECKYYNRNRLLSVQILQY
jgi:hypothetical protein